MNTLSWLIYAAEALSSARTVSVICAVAFGAASAAFLITFMISGCIGVADKNEDAERVSTWVRPKLKLAITGFFFSLLLIAFLPSSKTVYLIAASEAGEAVVTSPEAKEIMGDLKAIIKQKLKEQLGEGD